MSSIFLMFWLIFFIDLFFSDQPVRLSDAPAEKFKEFAKSVEENTVMLRLSKKHIDIDMRLINITYWMYYWYIYLLMIIDGYNILITVYFLYT